MKHSENQTQFTGFLRLKRWNVPLIRNSTRPVLTASKTLHPSSNMNHDFLFPSWTPIGHWSSPYRLNLLDFAAHTASLSSWLQLCMLSVCWMLSISLLSGKAESASMSDSKGVSQAEGLAWVNQSQLCQTWLYWEKIEMRYEVAASICHTAVESKARGLWIYFRNEFAELFKICICLKCS